MDTEKGIQKQLDIGYRLDRLPLNRKIYLIVAMASVAGITETLSIGSLGISLPAIKAHFDLAASEVGWIGAMQTLGVVFGLIPGGMLADRFGKKAVIIGGIAWYSLFIFLCAFANSYLQLVAFRFASGIGMGAIFPLPTAIICEFVHKTNRTIFSGFMDGGIGLGYFLAPLLGLLVFPLLSQDISWRVFSVIAAAPILYVIVLYVWLPESPRWLARRGRIAEAEAVVERLEAGVERKPETRRATDVHVDRAAAIATKQGLKGLAGVAAVFRRPLISRTTWRCLSAACAFFMFYVVMGYMPLILVQKGLEISASLMLTAVMVGVAIPGRLVNGWVSDRFGRKLAYAIFMGLAGVSALSFAASSSVGYSLLFGCAMSFFGTGVFPSLKTSYVEQYPVENRVVGAASVEAVGRLLGGVIGSYVLPLLLSAYGQFASFAVVAVVSFVGVLIELCLTVETGGRTLEEIEAEIAG